MDEQIIKRVMPHNQEAEYAVIGSMLIDAQAIDKAAEILKKEDFYSAANGEIFDSIREMSSQNKSIDMVTLQENLKAKNMSPESYSISVLGKMIETVPTAQNVREYAQIVAEKAMLRKLIKATESITDECYKGEREASQIAQSAEKSIFELTQKGSGNSFQTSMQIVIDTLAQINRASENKSSITGVSTGFTDLDAMTAGLQPSDLILIAARPSMGKTAFALNLATNAILNRQKPCATAVFSLEMSRTELMNRVLSMHSGVESKKMRIGNMMSNEWIALGESGGIIGKAPLLIDDTPGISITELRSKCRRFKAEYDLGLIIIDYLQLMTGDSSKKSESRQSEVSEISRSLKALARELNCPVIALSQLSRAVEQRQGDHRPMLSDLRESGAIEQDADVVMFIFREDYYNKETERKGISEIIIAKQRKGPIGTVDLIWQPSLTRFKNKERERKEE